MIDSSLLQKLHEEGVIDKKNLFWWQLGFEGRQVLSEEQFRQGLRELRYYARDPRKKDSEPFEANLRVYVKDEVPILVKNIEVGGVEMPCFITCCPMSHERGWRTLETAVTLELSPSWAGFYHQPHIRGVAVEVTKDFLFWYPFYFNKTPDFYTTSVFSLDRLDAQIITDPIHPSKFYMNLIKREWHKGKRPQKKPHIFDFHPVGLEFEQVPYFEFDPTKPCITIYPLPLFPDRAQKFIDAIVKTSGCSQGVAQELIRLHPSLSKIRKRLDLPVIIRSTGTEQVAIMGAGYLTEESAFYWPLSHHQYSLAKTALKERLGLEAKDYV